MIKFLKRLFKAPKILRVVYMGERLKDIYAYASTWQIIKYNFARGVRVAVIITILASWSVGSYTAGKSGTQIIYANSDKSEEMFSQKIEGLKNDVINELKACESSGATEDDGLVVYDPLVSNPSSTAKRNIPSFGEFQFKKDTVIHYFKMKTGKTLTQKEAILLALDTDRASELAKFIGFETKSKLSSDWRNCSIKYNLDSKVDLIKKFENN